ncbi:MAG: hypothetical protein AAF570_19530, partial [Bacteroidota bacterium]
HSVALCTTQNKDTLTVVFYNLLNFPNGGGGIPNRADTLEKIMRHLSPDVLMVCELNSAAAANDILNNALNTAGITHYQQAAFISNTSSGDNLQNLIYFNSNKLRLLSQQPLQTTLRDISKYTLYYNDPNLAIHQDTTFIDFYVAHLKASQGSTNQNRRNAEITILRNHLNSQPTLRNSILGADLNIYRSTEPAYQTITTTGSYPMQDPINTPGSWNNNGTFAAVHTQSTRTFQLGGDGASGGMDDRFDQILTSSNVISGADRVRYLTGTYRAVGQDGLHFNANLTDAPPNLSEPADIINALFYMSDHLPVFMQVEVGIPVPVPIPDGSLAAQVVDGAVQLRGEIRNGHLYARSFVERRAEGETFVQFAEVSGAEFELQDRPQNGNSFDYRLGLENQNGEVEYTPAVTVQLEASPQFAWALQGFGGEMLIRMQNWPGGEFELEMVDLSGKRKWQVRKSAEIGSQNVYLPDLEAGVWLARFRNLETGESMVRKIFWQNP